MLPLLFHYRSEIDWIIAEFVFSLIIIFKLL